MSDAPLSPSSPMVWSPAIRGAGEAIAAAAMAGVQNERGVRVEEYLSALAAATGEAAVVAAGIFDIEDNAMTPGTAVFGDACACDRSRRASLPACRGDARGRS